jgi:hypothetical protein
MTTSAHHLTCAAGALALVGVVLTGQPANALPIGPLFKSGVNTISDNSAELFVNKVGGATSIDVGDIFLGAIEIDVINNVAIGTGTAYNEFAGAFGLQVLSRVDLSPTLSGFTFGAVTNLQGEFLAATGVDIGATPAGTFALLYEDDTPDALRDGSLFADYVAATTDGTLRLQTTIDDGDIGATGPGDTTSFDLVAPGAGIPGLVFFNNPGSFIDVGFSSFPFTLSNITVNGSGQRPVAPEDFTIRDDATFTAVAEIPEPATLTLLGAGLVAAGFLRRRKSRG